MSKITDIARGTDILEEKDGKLELKHPDAESQVVKRLQEIYQKNPEYGVFLIENGYFFLGIEEPENDIKKLIGEKIPDKDNYCFSTSLKATKQVDRLEYVEGWGDDGSGVLRHAFCFDSKNESVIDLSVWNHSMLDEYNEKEKQSYYRGFNYFGVIIPEEDLDRNNLKNNQLEKFAEKNGVEDTSETLELMREDGKFEGKTLNH